MRTVTAILSRHWDDNCNTYHSTLIRFDDGTEIVDPMTLGNNDQFITTARNLLLMTDFDPILPMKNGRIDRNRVLVDSVDVRRRKDLHNAGRGVAFGIGIY